jgi:hypothetical protein
MRGITDPGLGMEVEWPAPYLTTQYCMLIYSVSALSFYLSQFH